MKYLIIAILIIATMSTPALAEGLTLLSISEVEDLTVIYKEGTATASFNYQGVRYEGVSFVDGMIVLGGGRDDKDSSKSDYMPIWVIITGSILIGILFMVENTINSIKKRKLKLDDKL